MKLKLIIISILFFIIFISCNKASDKRKDNTTSELNNIEITSKDKPKNITSKNEPQIVALEFYKWYLKDIYLKLFSILFL